MRSVGVRISHISETVHIPPHILTSMAEGKKSDDTISVDIVFSTLLSIYL